ncbi:MAG: hypothetical protein HY903_01205 [Deltaproteobacteria bacterium]|nr:hypothetical protein [Deltaproteobacteria bacterium]
MTDTPRARPHLPPHCDQLLVVMSDIEMGAGGVADDFPHSDFLAELVLSYNEPPFADLPLSLIFNGDTFDLLKTSFMGAYPRHINREVALGKMKRIAAAHPLFFKGLRELLGHTKAERRVYFVVGNHDAEILFPEVQELIREHCNCGDRVHFPGFQLEFGKVHIEHGGQLDAMFQMDPDQPFVNFDGEEVLNISWGSAALLDTVMVLHPLLCFHDRLKPKDVVFDILPDLKELTIGAFWYYWTRDYWRDYFERDDPTRKLSWSMVKELIWRFGSRVPDVAMDKTLFQRVQEQDRFALYVVGHQHQPMLWSYGDRKVIQNGCLRNEYMLVDDGRTIRPIAKSYSEAYLLRGVPVRSQLIEIEGPPAPPGYVPASVTDVLPQVRKLLAASGNHAPAVQPAPGPAGKPVKKSR